MNTIDATRPNDRDLAQAIEPLASYICATEQPQAVLNCVIAALFNEVLQTNRVARAHVTHRRFTGISK